MVRPVKDDKTCNIIEEDNNKCIPRVKGILRSRHNNTVRTGVERCDSLKTGRPHRSQDHIRVLFLGTSDSGKTTLGRQIRMLYGKPFTDKEIQHLKDLVRQSCLEDISNTFVEYMSLQNPTYSWTKECVVFLKQIRNRIVDRDLMDRALFLWKDPHYKRYLSLLNVPVLLDEPEATSYSDPLKHNKEERLASYQSDDPAYHLLPQLDVIMAHGYTPTMDDILSLRITTTGKISDSYALLIYSTEKS
jgi:hypothetical protein